MLEVFGDIDRESILNAEKLDLEGKAVLVDFWTYSCINCIRTVPALRRLHDSYRQSGLVVVGVHTPEFAFEKDLGNLRDALEELEISYPVVVDNDYYVWSWFNNQYWPAHYLFNREGELVHESVGEGGSGELQEAISSILGKNVEPGHEEPQRTSGRQSPEIYLGSLRGSIGNKPACEGGDCNAYRSPRVLNRDIAYLDGRWNATGEFIESAGEGSYIRVAFSGEEATMVLDPVRNRKFTVAFGDEKREIPAARPGAYNIFKGSGCVEREIKIILPEGARAYALTFG